MKRIAVRYGVWSPLVAFMRTKPEGVVQVLVCAAPPDSAITSKIVHHLTPEVDRQWCLDKMDSGELQIRMTADDDLPEDMIGKVF